MRRFLLFGICWFGVIAAFGQHPSSGGFFEVDEIKGCAPFTVTITNANVLTTGECTGGPSGKPCLMDFEGTGNGATNQFSFTYTTPGTYNLGVLYQSSSSADNIIITVVENTDPIFEVYTCTGNQVTLKVTDKKYDTYIIDFNGDNTPNIPDVTIPSGNNATAQFDYTPAPILGAIGDSYIISVRGKNVNSADNCKVLSENYTTVATLPQPSITAMAAVDANNLTLDMITAPQIQYKLEIAINNSSTFQVYQDLYQVNTVTVPNLLVDANFYCFRLNAFDPCAGTNRYSNIVCSQDFDVQYLNGVNQLDWKTSSGGVAGGSVDVIRNAVQLTQLPGSRISYPDIEYDCNEEYCYQIVTTYGGARSTSLTKCGIGKLETTFPAIENLTSVVRVGVELTWEFDPVIKIQAFDIYKSVPGQPLSPFGQSQGGFYNDATYDYTGGTCYQVNYGDFCNNRSAPGIIACPVSLSGTMDDKTAITLTWNKYTGYKDGVSTYEVHKYDQTGGEIGVYPTTDTTFVDFDPADDEQVVNYKIIVVATEPGVNESISNIITIEKPVRLILPTAFTPNSDGINPLFTISGKFVSKMKIEIFDRWGVLVFTSDNNEPWDGTRGGKVMPESAYVWKAEIEDFAGNTFTEKGTVLLLRPPR